MGKMKEQSGFLRGLLSVVVVINILICNFVFLFLSIKFCIKFPLGEKLQGWMADTKWQGSEWNWGAWDEIPKESIKNYANYNYFIIIISYL